jgi:hypothetical protein
VIELIEHPDLSQQLATQARESCEQYGWSKVRALWISLYQRAVGSADGVAAPINA